MNDKSDKQTSAGTAGKPSSTAPAPNTGVEPEVRTWFEKILVRVKSVFGFGKVKKEKEKEKTTDVGTRLAHQRTVMAMDRNYLAAERTLMAWIRTSLSMIGFGFTIGKLGQVLDEANVKGMLGRIHTMSIENIAYFLVILGTVALFAAAVQFWLRIHKLNEMGLPRQVSITFYVAIVLTAVGGFALTALVMAL